MGLTPAALNSRDAINYTYSGNSIDVLSSWYGVGGDDGIRSKSAVSLNADIINGSLNCGVNHDDQAAPNILYCNNCCEKSNPIGSTPAQGFEPASILESELAGANLQKRDDNYCVVERNIAEDRCSESIEIGSEEDEDDESDLRRSLFSIIDGDHDGKVTVSHLKSFLHTNLAIDFHFLSEKIDGSSWSSEPIDGGDEVVDFDGFVRLYDSIVDEQISNTSTDNYNYVDEDVESAFRIYDENGDGVINAEELGSILLKLGLLQKRMVGDGLKLTADEEEEDQERRSYCQSLIDRFDRNGDGVIDLYEFCSLFHC